MTAKIRILGSGNSAGVPAPGNDWGKCDPGNPRNRRSRPCITITKGATRVIVDTGADFRHQTNEYDISAIDAVFYTHPHGDHVNGIDDLLSFRKRAGRPVPVYGLRDTIEELSRRVNYLFTGSTLYPTTLEPVIIEDELLGEPLAVGELTVIPFGQDHGTCRSLGVRIGDTAYSTDMVNLDDQAVATLKGIKTWIADGAGYKAKKVIVHANIEKLQELNTRIGAQKIFLTHLSAGMDYDTMKKELPPEMEPAYDGLEIDVRDE